MPNCDDPWTGQLALTAKAKKKWTKIWGAEKREFAVWAQQNSVPNFKITLHRNIPYNRSFEMARKQSKFAQHIPPSPKKHTQENITFSREKNTQWKWPTY